MHARSADSVLPVAGTRGDEPTPLEIEVTQWFDQLRLPLFRYLSSFGLSAQDSEEVVQEVFLRLWERPERFDQARGSLRSFLLMDAHARCVDRIRSDSRRREREERSARAELVADYDLDLEAHDLEIAEQVREALATLSDGERRAIELAYFGGHTYREVARILEQPEGTIKSRIRTGLTRLRAQLVDRGIDGSWIVN